MANWIENLKVGDKVIVTSRFSETRIAEVENITPKGFVRVDGMLFNQDGSQRSTSWYTSRIWECTEEAEEELRRKLVIRRAMDLMRHCSCLDYEKAVKIIGLLEQRKEMREREK